jgi:hypothetical protein
MKYNLFEINERLQNEEITHEQARKELLILFDVVQKSEQLFCYHEGSYTLNEDGTCCKCHRLPKPKAN